jgi:hypothetical protein
MAITNPELPNHQPTSTSSKNNSATNALSLRISKVLATSQFDDPNIRKALDTLNSLTFQNPSSPHVDPENLGSKPNEIDCLQSLKKGGLRRIVEQRIRNRSREFLNVFSELNDVGVISIFKTKKKKKVENFGATFWN